MMTKIDEKYPKPSRFLELERKTLRFFKDDNDVHSNFPEVASLASIYFFQVDPKKTAKFSFETEFQLNFKKQEGKVYVGAKADASQDREGFDHFTYYAVISKLQKDGSSEEVLRKFHFDYAQPNPADKQPHPVFHFQYGGKPSQALREKKLKFDNICTWLSEPRLSYFPISLALLFNMIWVEFPDENSKKLIETRKWRSLVKENEELLLKPYFENCYNYFNHRKGDNLFTNDFYYGNN